MSVIYLESSALLALLLGEPRGVEVTDVINQAEQVACSVLTLMECRRALARAETLGMITPPQAALLREILEEMSRQWMVFSMNSTVEHRTGELFPVEPVRTLDAIHLSSALQIREGFPRLRFCTLDARIEANLKAFAMPVALPA